MRALILLTLGALIAAPADGHDAGRADGRIGGRVLGVRGEPAAGVRVILGELGHATLHYNTPAEMFVTTAGLADAERPRFAAELRTDGAGRFAVGGLAQGEFTVLAGDDQALALASVRSDALSENVEIALQPAAFVEGKINGLDFDPSLHVVELKPRGATMNVMLFPRLAQSKQAWTFRSAALPPIGGWQLHGTQVVLDQGFRATLFHVPADPKPGETSVIDLRFDDGLEVSGRVLGPEGEPLRNVSVVACSRGPRESREFGVITDARGEFRVRGLAPGAWEVIARRWKLRNIPGCGNGAQELHTSIDVALPPADGSGDGGRSERPERPVYIELRLAAFETAPTLGERAPDFEAATMAGGTLRLSALRGKVVLLDFWATWCGMCRMEMPKLSAAYAALAQDGRFEIVGVSLDEDVDLVRRFVASRRLAWPQTTPALADENPIARQYNVSSTPATVLIDRDGTIAALNLTGEPLRKKLEELLARK